MMKYIRLVTGELIPAVGLGTAGLFEDKCEQVIQWALEMGYRLIDTAWAYRNQEAIGKAIWESGVSRSEIFITSKIWRDYLNYEAVLEQCDQILDQLQVDYVDLLLTHWPSDALVRMRDRPPNVVSLEETLTAFNEIYQRGKIRHIGVSNYDADLLQQAQQISNAPISVNQVHFHLNDPNCDENASLSLVGFCHQSEVAVMAYCPLASGWCPAKGKLLQHPTLAEIASQHGKTPAQVALKWVMDRGTIIIPKSGSKVRLGQNIRILDFELSRDQTAQLNEL